MELHWCFDKWPHKIYPWITFTLYVWLRACVRQSDFSRLNNFFSRCFQSTRLLRLLFSFFICSPSYSASSGKFFSLLNWCCVDLSYVPFKCEQTKWFLCLCLSCPVFFFTRQCNNYFKWFIPTFICYFFSVVSHSSARYIEKKQTKRLLCMCLCVIIMFSVKVITTSSYSINTTNKHKSVALWTSNMQPHKSPASGKHRPTRN